jgi:hypothetical protein
MANQETPCIKVTVTLKIPCFTHQVETILRKPRMVVDLSKPLHYLEKNFGQHQSACWINYADNSNWYFEYGKDVNAYLVYLSSHGVPVDKLINQARTTRRRKRETYCRRRKLTAFWFYGLPIDNKIEIIFVLLTTDEQFDYLIGA